MNERPGPPPPPEAPWPQPPPPPPLVAIPGAAWGTPGAGGPPWSGGYPLPAPPSLAAGRGTVSVLASAAAVTAWLLVLCGSYIALRAAALPARLAGTPDLSRDSELLVVLAVILAASVAAGLVAARAWLRTVAAGTGAASIHSLLGPVSDPGPGAPGAIASVRRTAVVLAAGTAAGVGAVGTGLAAWLLADDPTLARVGLVVGLAGAAAVVLVLGFLPAFLRAIEQRERIAAPPDGAGRRVALPGARRPIVGIVAGVGALALVLSVSASVEQARLAIASCGAEPGWSCEEVTVPAIPGATGTRIDTVSVAYAIRPADAPVTPGQRRVLLIAVGGPGSSGIADAGWYAGTLPWQVLRAYDVVLFDARGVGATDRRTCPDAYRAYARVADTFDGARRFATACIDESGAAGLDLHRFGSAAVVEDVEAIRVALGVEELAVYGSSYGTVVAQAYAVAHPDRVSALVLDAPVDRRLDGIEVWQDAADGFGRVLEQTFRACGEDPLCDARLADPEAAWARLTRRMQAGDGLSVTMPDDSGTPVSRQVAAADVLSAIRSALYEPTGRSEILRALAAADRGDDRLLMRLVTAGGDPGWWPEAFAYYATWCADVRVSSTERADDTAAFGAALRERPVDGPGADSVVRTLLPCLYWPAQPALGEPPPDPPASVPTLIVTATADPITPDAGARRLWGRIKGARLIEVTGGGHVSLGNGNDCVDGPVATFLVDGRAPGAAITSCESWVADRFVALTPYGNRPIDLPWSIAVELLNDPAYAYWDGESVLVVPCLAAGVARISPGGSGPDTVRLEGCAMHEVDPPADGTGTISWYGSTADLEVTTAEGVLSFSLDGDRASATGTWKGEPYSGRD